MSTTTAPARTSKPSTANTAPASNPGRAERKRSRPAAKPKTPATAPQPKQAADRFERANPRAQTTRNLLGGDVRRAPPQPPPPPNDTRERIATLRREAGDNRAALANLDLLANHAHWGTFDNAVQGRFLDALARAPNDAAHARALAEFAGSADFRRLSAPIQSSALEHYAAGDATSRPTISTLARSPALGRLSAADQRRLVDYIGGSNTIISPGGRQALASMIDSAGYRGAGPDRQAAWLGDFMRDQPGSRALPNRATDPERADYRLTQVQGAPGQYRVRIGDRDITVHAPANVNNARQLIGADGRPIEIDGRPAYVHTPEQVARALAAMPAELRAMVNSVRLSGARNPDDAHWNTQYGRDRQDAGRTAEATTYADWAARYRQELQGPRTPFRSYATAGRAGDITFYPTSWDTGPHQAYLDSTIIHEAGHTYSARNFPQFEEWNRARTADRIVPSNYARNAATEDFSEMLSLYYVARGTPQEAELRRLMPSRFEIVDRLFPDWTRRR